MTMTVVNIREEANDIFTIELAFVNSNCDIKYFIAKPGQFIMVQVFGVGEKPFSIFHSVETSLSFTFKRIGSVTEALAKIKPHDLLTIRGPYGTEYTLSHGRNLLIGGGYATPPIRMLAYELKKQGFEEPTIINAARTQEYLLYSQEFNKLTNAYHEATDDGSRAYHGNAVELMRDLLTQEKFDKIYISGPEKMAYFAFLEAEKYGIPCEISLERYMKCGVGICGSCVLDPTGLILCQEGPVLSSETLRNIEDFGKLLRNKTGSIEKI
jgi:dihydroorotate dehydrogenase electron transfer subunit